MRKLIQLICATALVVFMATGAMALEVPQYKGYVTDLAGFISPGAEQLLNNRLAELERSDSTQIAVLTVPSLEGDSIEEFGIRVAEAWKVGGKENDNGAILIVSKADRRIRIEVGYGLEGVLTDVLSGQIIANVIGPKFKAGDYDGGFLDGVSAMTGAVRGEYTAAPQKRDRGARSGILPLIVIPMILIIAFTEMFGKRRRRATLADGRVVDSRHHHHSGIGSAASTLFFLSMLGGGHRGGGGGFGDGGGFGGFGGGGFGGGGASGDW